MKVRTDIMFTDNEREIALKWLERSEQTDTTIDAIVKLALHGLDTCNAYCNSHERLEFDACQCIRSVLPHPSHYELYKELRKVTQSLIILDKLITDSRRNND